MAEQTDLDSGRLGGFVARVLIVVLVAALALLAWQWRHVLLLIFASILIAAGLRGISKPLRKGGVPDGLSVILALLLVLAVIAAILMFFGAQISNQIEQLSDTLPQALQALRRQLEATELGRSALQEAQALTGEGGALSRFLQNAGRYGVTFASAALETLVVVTAGVFFALSPNAYQRGLLLMAPASVRPKLKDATNVSGNALQRWLAGTLVSMLSITIMVGGGLWLLGVPAPLALGLVAGLAQFVPLIGPILASGPGILLAFTVEPITALWAVLIYFAASNIEANILYPLIQKHAVSQAPVLTLYCVIAFGLLFGPLGVLLAVPVTLVTTIFLVKFYVNDTLGEQIRAPAEPKDKQTSSGD